MEDSISVGVDKVGIEKQFMIECEEVLPKIAERAGAVIENYMRLGEYVKVVASSLDDKACNMAVSHFSGSLSSAESRKLMRKYLESV